MSSFCLFQTIQAQAKPQGLIFAAFAALDMPPLLNHVAALYLLLFRFLATQFCWYRTQMFRAKWNLFLSVLQIKMAPVVESILPFTEPAALSLMLFHYSKLTLESDWCKTLSTAGIYHWPPLTCGSIPCHTTRIQPEACWPSFRWDFSYFFVF